MASRTFGWIWLVAPLALAAACTQSKDSGAPAAPAPPAPSFQREIAPVLATGCAAASGCHGAHPVDWVAMDLRPGAAYSSLVGREADTRLGQAFRVKPGDPRASYLLDKLTGNLRPREGKRMPLDPATGASAGPAALPAGFVEQTLAPWIAAGAPNN